MRVLWNLISDTMQRKQNLFSKKPHLILLVRIEKQIASANIVYAKVLYAYKWMSFPLRLLVQASSPSKVITTAPISLILFTLRITEAASNPNNSVV